MKNNTLISIRKSAKLFATTFLLLFAFVFTSAQVAMQKTEQSNLYDTTFQFIKKKGFISDKKSIKINSFIIPTALVTYGFVTMNNHAATSLNGKIQQAIWIDKPHTSKHYDNYLMFAPAVSVYGLNAFGIKGKNNVRDRTMIYLMSTIFATAIVYPTKILTKQIRPNSQNSQSFPSGHTAIAFASAEFMRMEFKEVSCWYGVAGYAMAAATGYLRMYNNKHWFSDVVAGAGIGIASSKIAYWLYPKIQHCLFKNKENKTMIMPLYQNKSIGFSFVHYFR